MELELILRKVGNGSGFLIPKIFLDTNFNSAFVEPKMVIGNRYRVIIEEVK